MCVTKSKFNLATPDSTGYWEAPSRLVVLITHQDNAIPAIFCCQSIWNKYLNENIYVWNKAWLRFDD